MSLLLGFLMASQIIFGSPVHYDIELAGNFAEPRPNHFHGGIDIKTGQVEGKALYSIGDGYVSQITIGLFGFGNALYIHHPEGYTSVYCHLKCFSSRIISQLRKHQYIQQQSVGTFRFSPGELPVAKGDFVAFSGNTGSSQAPHLHLEVHDNLTWSMHDPLMFIGQEVKDGMPPQAHGFMATPIEGEGVFGGSSAKQVFGFGRHDLQTRFTAWGKVGFGVWANDYMEATYNNYGIRRIELYVDNHLVFCSDASQIPVEDNLQVNYWGDYQHYLRSHVWYMRSWLLPGVSLPIFETNGQRGVVDFKEERDYHVMYLLSDFRGNQSRYTFTVHATPTHIPSLRKPVKPLRQLRWDKYNNYQLPGMQLKLPCHILAEHVVLEPTVNRGRFSLSYRLKSGSYPLLSFAHIMLRATSPVKDPSKLYVVSQWGSERYMGGVVQTVKNKNGKPEIWVTGKLRELGATYTLAYDDEAPRVGPVGTPGIGGVITMGMTDNQSGLKSFAGYVDGKFVPFDEVPKSPWVRCVLTETPIRKTGKLHHLRFMAVDNRDNKRIYETDFSY